MHVTAYHFIITMCKIYYVGWLVEITVDALTN